MIPGDGTADPGYLGSLRERLRAAPHDEEAAAALAAALAAEAGRLVAGDAPGLSGALAAVIAEWDHLAAQVPPGHWLLPALDWYRGTAYDGLWQRREDPRDLAAALRHARAGLAADPADQGLRALLAQVLEHRLAAAAPALDDRDRAGLAAFASDRDEAITVLRGLLAEVRPSGEPWPGLAAALGRLRYDRWGFPLPPGTAPNPGDLEAGCDLLLAAAERDPSEPDVRALLFALQDRLEAGPSPSHRDAFITWGTWFLGHPDGGPPAPAGDPDAGLRAHLREGIALALLDRAPARVSDADRYADLDAAIAHYEAFLAATGPGGQERAAVAALLADACWDRVDGDASRYEQVDRLVRHAREAWRLLGPGTGERPMIGLYLGTGLYEQCRRPDAPYQAAAVHEAIGVLTEVEPALAGQPEAHRAVRVMLGLCLVARAQAEGTAADLAAATPLLLGAAREVDPADPRWREVTQTLAAATFTLAHLGQLTEHLDVAAGLLTAAAGEELAAAASPETAAMTRAALGLVLIMRAQGRADRDLRAGIAHLTAAYELAPPGSETAAMIAFNLGGALLTRYQLTGNRQELAAARLYLAGDQLAAGGPAGGGAAGGGAGTAVPGSGLMAGVPVVTLANQGLVTVITGIADGDPAAIDAGAAGLRAAIGLLPPGHPHRLRLRADLAAALASRATLTPGDADPAEPRRLAAELAAIAAELPPGHLTATATRLHACAALAEAAQLAGDRHELRAAADAAARLRDEVPPGFGDAARVSALAGRCYSALHEMTGDAADLAAAGHWLTQAAAEFEAQPGHPGHGPCLLLLARLRRRAEEEAGAPAAGAAAGSPAVRAGLALLRVRTRQVLLQSGPRHGLAAAREAASEAAEVAGWCLADGDAGTAVRALELGRGLVLHAATAVAGLPELLTAAGHRDLAARWRELTAAGDAAYREAAASHAAWEAAWDTDSPDMPGLPAGAPLAVPGDLRERTLAALSAPDCAGSAAVAGLVEPPNPADIAGALVRTRADALVYLLPPPASRPGRHGRPATPRGAAAGSGQAVVVTADGTGPAVVPLPLLAAESGPLDGYSEAHDEALTAAPPPGPDAPDAEWDAWEERRAALPEQWKAALGGACAWAWTAVIEPLLESQVMARATAGRPGGPPRLVLVPVGRLALVPWHAARGARPGGGWEYACERAVFSYAASGRQLVLASRRPASPPGADPVIVAPHDGTRDELAYAVAEAMAIRDRYYPGARVLGGPRHGGQADGAGTPDEVLAVLPSAASAGASMLHFACHGEVDGAAPERSHLVLAGGKPLPVREVLRQAAGRAPDAPGGLVGLSACRTDLTATAYDEALTLATAFLAAGAATVIGTRWGVPDGPSAVLMFMCHHFLVRHGHEPRDALRAAQLWMLDADREIPDEMPPRLRELTALDLADLAAWAAFIHQGR